MEVTRQLQAGQQPNADEMKQGLRVLDRQFIVRLDASESLMVAQHTALMFRENMDSLLGLQNAYIEKAWPLLAARFPLLDRPSVGKDNARVAEVLRTYLPVDPATLGDDLIAGAPPLFASYMKGVNPDYMKESANIIQQHVMSSQLKDPVAEVSAELLESGDARVGRWRRKEINGLELMLSVGLTENMYLRNGKVLRLTDAELEAEKRQTARGRQSTPTQLMPGREDWLTHGAQVKLVYPEMVPLYAQVEEETAKASCKGCARNSQLYRLVQMAANLALKDKTQGVKRDLTPLRSLFRPDTLAFLDDPVVAYGEMYVRRAVMPPPAPPASPVSVAGPAARTPWAQPAPTVPGVVPTLGSSVLPRVSEAQAAELNMSNGKRHSCLDCYRKHVAQAQVLLWECLKGYPQHIWLAIAHLAEAAEETEGGHPNLAAAARLQLAHLESTKSASGVDLSQLVSMATFAADSAVAK